MKMINIKKTDENAKTPTYGSEFAAGADLYAVIHNYVGLIYARSGLACKQGLFTDRTSSSGTFVTG